MENYNIIGYCIYLPITFYMTIVVGKICYLHGEIYLSRIIHDKPEIVASMNKLLLLGYYLLNLGYAAVTLSFWHEVNNPAGLIAILCTKLGIIITFLGVMHVNNMLVTYLISKKLNKQLSLKPSLS
ncbi:MAG: putative transrane protein of unknown function [Chitinophagaceae bacterium]|nr:putative transrane protein of unknown function [Chitinophagaceae bacterium]